MNDTITWTNLILTWPKSRTLESYLEEMKRAERKGLDVNFRSPNPPKLTPNSRWGQAFMVHDGAVRGYSQIIEVTYREWGRVQRVESDPESGYWPPGWYVVREPLWFPLADPISMRGFQGFRYSTIPMTEFGRPC